MKAGDLLKILMMTPPDYEVMAVYTGKDGIEVHDEIKGWLYNGKAIQLVSSHLEE